MYMSDYVRTSSVFIFINKMTACRAFKHACSVFVPYTSSNNHTSNVYVLLYGTNTELS